MRALVLAGIVLVSGWAEQSQVSKSPDEVDPSLEHYVQRGNRAIRALQTRLVKALTDELNKGGPAAAVRVCRDEAQAITRRMARDQGVAVGRTSHLLRNPINTPRDWMKPFVAEGVGKRANQVESQVVDLGDRIGILKPIGILELCTNCHGIEEEIATEVKAVLTETYPADRAIGFRVGDLRGWMWAEVPKK